VLDVEVEGVEGRGADGGYGRVEGKGLQEKC